MISRRKILSITALTAFAVRVIFAATLWTSPYRFYHVISSLDMATHLRLSDGVSFPPLFVAHRLLLQGLRLLAGGTHCVWMIFATQAFLGICGAVATAELALRLWRDRAAALFAGIFAAVYGPYLIYEFAVLQEAVLVDLMLVAILLLLIARAKRYPWHWTLAAAICWLLALAGRPAGILLGVGAVVFTIADTRTPRCLRFAGILFVGFWGAMFFNHYFAGSWNPFFRIDYVVAVNRSPGASSSWGSILLTAAGKIPLLFSVHEIPENLNYYFLCAKLPFLAVLPRPEGLLPLAATGVAALIAFSHFRGRALLPGIVILLLMAPLAARYPIGRYRLMLVPYLILYAACIVIAFRHTGYVWWKNALLLLAILGISAGMFFLSPARVAYRSDDDYAWGIACEAANDWDGAITSYHLAWRNGAKRGAAQRLFVLLMKREKGEAALGLTAEVLARYPGDEKILFDQALAFGALHRDEAARRILLSLQTSATDPAIRQNAALVLQKMGK